VKTVITITVYHDRLTKEENRLFDQFVSPATLRIPGYGAQSALMEVLGSKSTINASGPVLYQSDIKLEVTK
jgi:hypothetical protein